MISDPELCKLADDLRVHRMRLRLPQQHVAERLGITRMTLYNWECGKTAPKTLRRYQQWAMCVHAKVDWETYCYIM